MTKEDLEGTREGLGGVITMENFPGVFIHKIHKLSRTEKSESLISVKPLKMNRHSWRG